MNDVQPLSQANRPLCSLPLSDADLSLDNSNYTKGLQSMSDWIWSANLNPVAFPNHLGRYFLHIPGIFEQQLNYSTTLIFDEPSYKNGIQVSGFVNRVHKELTISFIAQKRRAWYSMTHHAILGKLTNDKHGIDAGVFANKMYNLCEYDKNTEYYSSLELKILDFALAFSTDPKEYKNEQMEELRDEFRKYNVDNYKQIDYWQLRKEASNFAKTKALSENIKSTDEQFKSILNEYIAEVPKQITKELNEIKVNAQIVELAFLCLQFVALTCVFTGLNIPDESFLNDVMVQVLPGKVIEKINELNELGLEGVTPDLLPPAIEDLDVLIKAITKGQIKVEPANLKGARVPLTPYEGKDESGNFRPAFAGIPDKDKGLTVGGVQVGTYGWGFGGHFPGSLVYCLMNHPELARFEAPYSLPLLFNEDEWRNGVQTSGYVSRKLKELVIHKIYKTNRSRYGLEHHTMFLFNAFLDEYGVGRILNPSFTQAQIKTIKEIALKHAEMVVLYMNNHMDAPIGTFSQLEEEILTWVEELLKTPHKAYEREVRVRGLLTEFNELEINIGIRVLDKSPGIGDIAAMKRLIDHQVAELVMLTGHMDGLGRLLTILKLEAEDAVQVIEGKMTNTGEIKPELDNNGNVKFTGFFNNRPALHQILNFIGVSENAQTLNELFVNPVLCTNIINQFKANPSITINVKSINEGSPEF